MRTTDALTYEAPDTVQERADDTLRGDDYAVVEAIFRSDLDRKSLPSLMRQVADVLEYGPRLSTDEFIADLRERWGTTLVLSALTRATEPRRLSPLVDTVEFE